MGASIGAEWRSRLKAIGFKPQGTGGRAGTYATRNVGPLSQAVGVLIDDGSRAGAFNVQLNINMPLPYAGHDVVILLADVGPEQVRIQEPWVHDSGFTAWWPPSDLERAWQAFLDLGVPWFERNSRVEDLADYFEKEYHRLEVARTETSRPNAFVRTLQAWGLVRKPLETAHGQYLLWLSMLYGAAGAADLALKSLDSYAQYARARGVKHESTRLIQHRKMLEEQIQKDTGDRII